MGVGGVQGWVLVVYKGGCWWCTGVGVGGVQGLVLVVYRGGCWWFIRVGVGGVWYAGVAVPQVLQQLREFDAPAMQSCKPLPCGTGSCQNRRLREQTLNRKPCHCGSIKGG